MKNASSFGEAFLFCIILRVRGLQVRRYTVTALRPGKRD